MHGLVEDFVARLAKRLGAVHGCVCVAQNVFGALVACGAWGDAHADGREDLAPAQCEGHAQLLLYALGDLYGLKLFDDVLDEYCELVAAEARDRVAGSEVLLESVGDADEELVADGVAQRVVDYLEAVEVEIEDCEGRVGVAARARDGELEVIHEERAVRQSGERVVEGVVV